MKILLTLKTPGKRKLRVLLMIDNFDDNHSSLLLSRSLIILLGVLYRYQKRIRSRELDLASDDLDCGDLCQQIGVTCARCSSYSVL